MARGHLSEEGFVFGGVVRRLESGIVEEPLQEVYAPAPGLKPLPSVDLRRFFSPVRDQGPVGSCTAFAVAGMYEAIMNRNNPSLTVNADLSERFIFYHTNINKGKDDEGSSFHDQLNVMGRFGICAEALFPYTPECMDAAPSAAATADALNHRVTLARQVPLRSEGSKYDCVTANHAMLTSALTEGYPVGISLMLFDDFGRPTLPLSALQCRRKAPRAREWMWQRRRWPARRWCRLSRTRSGRAQGRRYSLPICSSSLCRRNPRPTSCALCSICCVSPSSRRGRRGLWRKCRRRCARHAGNIS
mgnify:CR=1 FL=1